MLHKSFLTDSLGKRIRSSSWTLEEEYYAPPHCYYPTRRSGIDKGQHAQTQTSRVDELQHQSYALQTHVDRSIDTQDLVKSLNLVAFSKDQIMSMESLSGGAANRGDGGEEMTEGLLQWVSRFRPTSSSKHTTNLWTSLDDLPVASRSKETADM